MKGFKGFNKGLVCRDKQYEENKVFEEDTAEIYKSGMHFCKTPFDVLDYYPLFNNNGEPNEFAEVEALDETETDDNKKYCTKKLKIGGKIRFADFVKLGVEYIKEETIKDFKDDVEDNGAQIGSSGYGTKIGSSGDSAKIGSSGYNAQIGSSGYGTKIGSSGDSAKIGSSGYNAQIGSSGYGTKIGSSGDSAQIGSSGANAQIGSSGDGAQIGSYGANAQIGSSGANAQIGSSGDGAKIGSSGDGAQIGSSGDDSVVMCAGINNVAKAKKGSWITLSEWEYSNEKGRYIPVCVKTEQVDGERIKEDTFYKLIDGEFEEVKRLKRGE